MIRHLIWLCGMILALLPNLLSADQQVTLKSGTRLIGTVRFEEESLIIAIDGAELTLPLSEIDLVAPVGADSGQPSERLLMIALESRLQHGSGEALIGILAEASRQAPGDARIAYWYANSLLDAGYGLAAQRVFDSQRDAIFKTYPGIADRLAAAIEKRVALASLPPELVSKLDRLHAAIENRSQDTDEIPTFTRFHILDQNHKPLETDDFHIECNGREEQLASFGQGYYLFSFKRYLNNASVNCRLIVDSPGLEPKQFELATSSNRVADAGDLVVRRYEEQDKVKVRFQVVDRHGNPIPDATVTLSARSRGSTSTNELSARTGPDGKAEITTFPMTYNFSVQRKGFNPAGGSLTLQPQATPERERIELFPQRTGTIRVAWTATALQADGVTNSGEAVLKIGSPTPPSVHFGPESVTFVRPQQVRDEIKLLIGQSFYPGPIGVAVPWVREMPLEEKAGNEPERSPLEQFKSLDLKEIDVLKKSSRAVQLDSDTPRGPRGPVLLVVKQGQILLGQVVDRDPRSGQPTLISFKLFIEHLANESP